jgi:hypothetical protein
MFTPIPWKLLDDTAIWTQNWSLIPQLAHGPISTRFSHCTLCPAGCTVKVRCCNGAPVGIAGVPKLAVANGVLCAVGFAAHHLPYHPLRLSGPQAFTGKDDGSLLLPVALDAVVSTLAPKLRAAKASESGGTVAVLDQRPGRSMSQAYRAFLAEFPGSQYIVDPSGEDGTLRVLRSLVTEKCPPLGYDFENSRTVLSFGAPLLDGWGVPERMYALFGERSTSGRTLIQIESSQSRTARAATTWLPVVPGTEAAVALSLANVIIREGLYPKEVERSCADFPRYRDLALRYHPHAVSAIAGVTPDALVDTARAIASSPSIILTGGDPARGPMERTTEILVAGLNLLLGNLGKQGGIAYIADPPNGDSSARPGTPLQEVADNSISVLLMDGAESGMAFPPSLLKRKLVKTGGTVVLLSPYLSARSATADYLIPTPTPGECWEDTPTPPGARATSFSLAVPMFAGRESSVDAMRFLHMLSKASGMSLDRPETVESLIRERVVSIAASRRGMVFPPDGSEGKPVASFSEGDALWPALAEGGCWVDGTAEKQKTSRFTILGALQESDITLAVQAREQKPGSLTLVPFGTRGALSGSTISPILSKLFQESDLRIAGGSVLMNPATAAQYGLVNEDQAVVRSKNGALKLRVLHDPTVMPGLLYAAVGPLPNDTPADDTLQDEGVLALCTIQDDGSWRFTEATMEKV